MFAQRSVVANGISIVLSLFMDMVALRKRLGMTNLQGRPLILIAHGFGGIIVKKAIQLCFMTHSYPRTKNALAGVVFFGTPHADTDSGALLQSVRGTIDAFGPKDGTRGEGVREFISIVSRINTTFITCKPSYLRLLSFWEKLPPQIGDSSADLDGVPVVPLQCQNDKLRGNTDHIIDCSHEELPRFSSVFSDRFMQFMQIFSQFLVDTLSERTVTTVPALLTRTPSHILERRLPIEEIPGRKKRDPIIKSRRRFWNKSDDDRQSLEHRKKEKEDTASRENFLRSLRGWSEINYGNEIYVTAGTCEWFRDDVIYKDWLTDPIGGTIFYIGPPGHGKSHLARAISTHLKSSKTEDIVLSYFCQKGEEKPAIWDYFTWKLIKEWPDWFSHVPNQFRRKNDDTNPHLDSSAYAEIWTSFRKARSPRTIYLIVDGLEQTPSTNFTEFFTFVEHLRQPVALEPEARSNNIVEIPTKIKLFITSRWTDATYAASAAASCCSLPEDSVKKDVSLYLDKRFLAISNSRPKSENDLILKIKERVNQKAGPYWLFAKLATDEIEKSCGLNGVQDLREDYVPMALTQLYEQKMLPLLQSTNNSERHLRTILTFIASESNGLAFAITQLESILECLYGQDDTPVESLAKSIQTYCGGLFSISPADSLVYSVHASVRAHLSNYLSLEHRQSNIVFICLKYLLQDRFRSRLPLSWTDRDGTAKRLNKEAPLYVFASQNWLSYLAKLETLSPQLLPLLQAFLSIDCPQYQTWRNWRAWLFNERTQGMAADVEDPIMIMVREGCLAVVEHFLPSSTAPRAPWGSRIGIWARQPSFSTAQTCPNGLGQWPDITGLRGETLLMAAALSGKPAMVEHVLQWVVDVNARDDGGRTALMLCLTSDRLMSSKNQEEKENVYGVVETLLLKGSDPNLSEYYGITPLHVVSVRGRLDLAQLLLRFNALVNVTDSWGFSPLERAYSTGNRQLVELLILAGADVGAWMLGGEPPLARCIFDGNLDMFKAFLPYANINQATMRGFAPIHLASDGADRIEFLRLLLARPDLHLNAVSSLTDRFQVKRTTAIGFAISSCNYTALEWLLEAGAYPGMLPMVSVPPLHDAVIVQDTSMVELLLLYGAPVNEFKRNWFPFTALGHAVDLGLEDIVKVLLQNGADASTEEGYGVMALIETAVTRGAPIPNIVKLLLESRHPPDVNYRRDNDDHCVMCAVDQGDSETISILLEHGADIGKYLEPGESLSPFHQAARKGHVEICDILLKHEPKFLDLQLEKGFMIESPLFAACHKKQKKVVRFLLDKGARADQLNYHYKESPLFTACDVGDFDIVKMILEAAPQMINVLTSFDYTPLGYACRHGNLEMVKLLIDAGADIYHHGSTDMTSAFSQIFEAKGDKPFRVLELLLRSGLDLHAVDKETGLTVLGMAIVDAEARHVKWLLEHGADPLRAHRAPGGKEQWRTALQVATHTRNKKVPAIVELLLEPRWGLWDHLTLKDYYGEALLPVSPPCRNKMMIVSRLLSFCDSLKETGKDDILSTIMNEPNVAGLSPVDCAVGNFSAKPSAIPELDKLIVTRIDELLAGPRTTDKHLLVLDHIVTLLYARGRYDRDTKVLAEFILTRPHVRWDDSGYYMGTVSLQLCFVCNASIRNPYVYCPLCEESWCLKNRGKDDAISLHRHRWVHVELRKDLDINAPDIQETLEKLRKELSCGESTPNGEKLIDSSTISSPPSPTPAQISLQLATLHAFNFLAVSRPIWTPFLPLSPATQALVDPWQKLWSQEDEYCQRKRFMERRTVYYENSAWRRFQELQYLRRGFTRAYADEEGIRRDFILWDLRRLYDEEEVVRVLPKDGVEVMV
ncbi:hypothetical protein TARUN_6985 [Trichoderma arundinaceum]|uniref:Nephrocystin 3-like N-terminal domain-containing protein n=1 Tax=Trichoderma arundinaceum TaxID=490622 RepID=A0A395NHH1_TRIAR|nr:hypothetical protein TARUN_6985 [Trichoderma arundinaceum]